MSYCTKKAAIIRAAAAGVLALSGPAFAVDTVYDGPVGGTWDNDSHWRQEGLDGSFGTPDDVIIQPGTADAAVIVDHKTVNLSTVETVLEAQVGFPAHEFDTATTHGVARLNVLPGAVLTTNGNSSGIRVGRALDVGQAIGSSRGEIIQTGGSVVIQQGSNGLRLSQADAGNNVADSYYEISGGSVRGGAGADGAMVANLAIGTITNVWDEAEFHVVGSAPTSVRFLDVALGGNTSLNGDAILHFSLDAGGVTPIIAEDELQFRGAAGPVMGNNLLEIDLIGEAPSTNIRLVTADRLNTNGIGGNAAFEIFTGMPEGTSIIEQFGGFEYTWTLDYQDGADDYQLSGDPAALDAFVELVFVSKVSIGGATLYWDTNGTTSGAGGATPSGNWDGVATNFNTDSGGGAGTISAATAATDTVVFAAGNDATGAYTVTVSGTRSAAQVNFEEGNVNLTGGTLAVPAFNVSAGVTGTVVSNIAAPGNSLTKSGAGTLQVGKLPQNHAVTISGGTVRILESNPNYASGHPSGDPAMVSQITSLTVDAGATLDITNNDVIVDYSGTSPAGDLEALVRSAYNVNGTWDGDGITSSIAAVDSNYVVAIADNATLAAPFGSAQGGPLFNGVDVDLDTVLIKFTHRVDINLDGLITPDDASVFGTNYDESITSGFTFAMGDVDFDGACTPNDAAIFGTFYDEALQPLPEPGCLAMIGLLGLAARRRRQAVR